MSDLISKLIPQLIKFITQWMQKPDSAPTLGIVPEPAPGIDWTNAACKITENFTVGEIITLHFWNRLATIDDGLTDDVKANLITLCEKLEKVRVLLGVPLNIHCGFRSQDYNRKVLMSLPADVHSFGEAGDLDALPHLSIEQAKEIVMPHLEELGLRLEKGTATWLHLDFHKVGPSGRIFTA